MSTIFDWRTEAFDDLLNSCEWDPLTPYVHAYFTPPGPILEAGCGAGRFVKYLHDRDFDCRGIEFNPVTVRNVKDKWPELQVVQGDVERMPYADGTFKGLLAVGLIEHFEPGPEKVLGELWRVLKPGGIGLITVPCLNGLRRLKGPFCGISHMVRVNPLVRAALGKRKYRRCGWNLYSRRFKYHVWPEWGEFYEYRFTPTEFEGFLRNARFDILESVPLDQIGGMYHEFGRLMARYDHCRIELYPHARMIHRLLSRVPFLHNHMHLCVARKRLANPTGESEGRCVQQNLH
jgi:SAM-dependent methyltransferase